MHVDTARKMDSMPARTMQLSFAAHVAMSAVYGKPDAVHKGEKVVLGPCGLTC